MANDKSPGRQAAEDLAGGKSFPKDIPYDYAQGCPKEQAVGSYEEQAPNLSDKALDGQPSPFTIKK